MIKPYPKRNLSDDMKPLPETPKYTKLPGVLPPGFASLSPRPVLATPRIDPHRAPHAHLASLEVFPQILVPTLHEDPLHQTGGEDQAVHHVLQVWSWFPGDSPSWPIGDPADVHEISYQLSSKLYKIKEWWLDGIYSWFMNIYQHCVVIWPW